MLDSGIWAGVSLTAEYAPENAQRRSMGWSKLDSGIWARVNSMAECGLGPTVVEDG